VDELLQYDAIIWATGEYWDDSISEEDAALLSKYVGLAVICSGRGLYRLRLGSHRFLTNVAHADYLTTARRVILNWPCRPSHC